MNSPYSRRRVISGDVESRLSAVETAVEHIEANMSEIKDSINSGFVTVNTQISKQADSARPQIVAWAGWAAVILLVIGMFGSGYIRDLTRAEHNIDILSSKINEHIPEYSATTALSGEKVLRLQTDVQKIYALLRDEKTNSVSEAFNAGRTQTQIEDIQEKIRVRKILAVGDE